MPIIKSAKKRVKVAQKAAIRNRKTKRSLKEAVKIFQKSLGGTQAAKAHASAQSAIGKAAKKHVIHKNKAARQQRQLAAKAKAAGVKISGTKSSRLASKPAAKKTSKPSAKTTAKKS